MEWPFWIPNAHQAFIRLPNSGHCQIGGKKLGTAGCSAAGLARLVGVAAVARGPLPSFTCYVRRCDTGCKSRLSLYPFSLRCIAGPGCGLRVRTIKFKCGEGRLRVQSRLFGEAGARGMVQVLKGPTGEQQFPMCSARQGHPRVC